MDYAGYTDTSFVKCGCIEDSVILYVRETALESVFIYSLLMGYILLYS